MFGGEVLLRGFSLYDAIPLILSSVIGATTASIFLGEKLSFLLPRTPHWTPAELPLYLVHGDYNSNARALYPRLHMGVKIGETYIIIEAQINYYDIGEDLRRDKAVIDLIDKNLQAIGYRTLFNIIDNYLSHII